MVQWYTTNRLNFVSSIRKNYNILNYLHFSALEDKARRSVQSLAPFNTQGIGYLVVRSLANFVKNVDINPKIRTFLYNMKKNTRRPL